jgi:hypothetical protein
LRAAGAEDVAGVRELLDRLRGDARATGTGEPSPRALGTPGSSP